MVIAGCLRRPNFQISNPHGALAVGLTVRRFCMSSQIHHLKADVSGTKVTENVASDLLISKQSCVASRAGCMPAFIGTYAV